MWQSGDEGHIHWKVTHLLRQISEPYFKSVESVGKREK